MKKKLIIILAIVLFIIIDTIILILTLNKKENNKEIIKEDKPKEVILETIELKDLTYEYDSDTKLKDVLNIEIDGILDTLTLGDNQKEIIQDNKKYIINYTVVDVTPPLIIGSTTKTTTKGTKIDLVNKYMCGDNHDTKPKCTIEGEYDINKVGTYSLTYRAEDESGNKSSKAIKLKVINKSSSSSSSSASKGKTPLKDYINKYKNENTKIGIDVSAWQDDIDWKKAKADGVEFAMLRIGYGPTSSNEIKLDKWFNNNIKKAKEQGIPVGVYLYSYAKTIKDIKEQAKWIKDKLNGQTLELPIAFDWENWSTFNKYDVSFKELNDLAKAFIEEVENYGYEGMLYSSAYYLNHIWKEYDNTWLAYYTKNNDYSKSYTMWQLTSSGKVNGISGPVDVNILYSDKNNH